MKGRKPTPTALKLLTGNPGKRPLPEHEPTPAAGLPDPPPHITGNALEAWWFFGRSLAQARVLTHLDRAAMELLCIAYAAWLDAQGNVLKYGAVFIESKGEGLVPKFAYSPYWAIANREWDKVKQMLAVFGMTPADRTKVKVDTSEPDEFDKFRMKHG